MVKKKQLQML